MLDDIDQIPEIDEHIIITNHKFAGIFEEWKKERQLSILNSQLSITPKPITIVDDGSTTNDNRLGAVCDLLLVLESLPKQGDLEGRRSRPPASCAMSSALSKNSSAQVW